MEDESEEDNDCCIICNTQLPLSETVTSKGIKTVIDSSLKSKDELHSKFDTLPTIILHNVVRNTLVILQ